MQSGSRGMGSHKHGVSGRVPINTRSKVLRQIEANKPQPKKPKSEMFPSVSALMKAQ